MTYVLVRTSDGAFVARPGSSGSYTRDIRNAAVYSAREVADRNSCGNEHPVHVDDLFTRPGSFNDR